MEPYVFWPVAVIALGSAIGMVIARNAVHGALLLVLNFFALAVFYILLEAEFLAAVQIIVYAGAIMVLFLFVIMLLGVDREDSSDEPIPFQRPLAFLFGAGLAAMLVFTLRTAFSEQPFAGLEQANQGGNVQALGRGLFTKYLLAFEVTSVLLIVAAIGAVLLARRIRSDDGEPRAPGPAAAEAPQAGEEARP